MANGKQLGAENLAKFQAWVGAQTDEDFIQLVYRGQLNRTQLSKLTGINKKAITGENPDIAKELKTLEDGLRERNILPTKTEAKAKEDSQPKEYDQSATTASMNKRRLSKLERENIELEAKLRESKVKCEELEAKLREVNLKFAKYKEFKDSIDEHGIIPR